MLQVHHTGINEHRLGPSMAHVLRQPCLLPKQEHKSSQHVGSVQSVNIARHELKDNSLNLCDTD